MKPRKQLLADTKAGEYFAQEIVGCDGTRNRHECFMRFAQFFGKQFLLFLLH